MASGHFHHVPKKWTRWCEEHVMALAGGTDDLQGDFHRTDMTSRELWKATLDELRLQMTHATFDSCLRGTYIAGVGSPWL